ncbi:L,D-transpeptidase [Streptomyces sp. NPDC002476]|uniref:L,D-transpeptidase n=1 Tax=Streptomyces sp. NPDC002476 TaxID=3364648 RepID=UPI00368774D4
MAVPGIGLGHPVGAGAGGAVTGLSGRGEAAKYFDGGQAIHGRYDDPSDRGGSAGCVNLRLEHAKTLWDRLGIGDQVYVRGRRPST